MLKPVGDAIVVRVGVAEVWNSVEVGVQRKFGVGTHFLVVRHAITVCIEVQEVERAVAIGVSCSLDRVGDPVSVAVQIPLVG